MQDAGAGADSFNETLRLALDRIKVLEVANRELEERIKTQERMILELVERNHLLSRAATQPSCDCHSSLIDGNNRMNQPQSNNAIGASQPNGCSSQRPASLAPMHARKESSSSSENSKRSLFSPGPNTNATGSVAAQTNSAVVAALTSSNEYNSHEYSVPNNCLAEYDVNQNNSQSPTRKAVCNENNTINDMSTCSGWIQ